MSPTQVQAIQLRKAGKSYSEISTVLDVPKSTLSFWLHNIHLSNAQQKHLVSKSNLAGIQSLLRHNKEQTVLAKERSQATRLKASRDIKHLNKNDLFLIGVALYWAEGYKRGADGSSWKCIDFANSDPDMITLMMTFFRKYSQVAESKFRIHLMLHDPKKEKQARTFWSNVTNLPLKQFVSTSFVVSRASQQKKPANLLPYGTIHIRIHSVQLFFKMIGWIDRLRAQASSGL